MTPRRHVTPASVVLLGLVALGCGDEAAPATIAPEPTTPPALPSEVTAAPAATPEPAPAPDVELEVFSLPPDWTPSIEALEVGHNTVGPELAEAIVPVFAIEPPEVAEALNGAIERALTSAVVSEAEDGEYVSGSCRVTLASATLVSMACILTGSGGRTGFDRSGFTLSLRIVDGTAQPVTLDDAFAPDVDLAAIAARACHTAYAADAAEEDGYRGESPWCDTETYGLTFGASGVRIHSLTTEQFDSMDVEIGYDDPALAGRFLVDGPLAAILPMGERTSRTFTPDQMLAAELRADCHVAWVVGPTRSLEDTLLATDVQPPRIAALIAAGDGFRPVYGGCAPTLDHFRTEESTARSLSPDGVIERLQRGTTTLPVARYSATNELALRGAPSTDAAYLGTLSVGTWLSGIEGTFDGHPSEGGLRGTWLRASVGVGVSGWVASRYVALRSSRCSRPSPARVAAALPPAATGASVTFSEHEGAIVVSARGRDQSWIAISDSCSLVPIQRTIVVPGRIESVAWLSTREMRTGVLVTSSAADVGEPNFDGVLRIMLIGPEATEPGWSMEAPAHPTLPSNARATLERGARASGATWDVAVRVPRAGVRRARWDGAAFVESTGR